MTLIKMRIVAPNGKRRGLVIVININPQCYVVWEHVDTTSRSTRSQISSNSGLREDLKVSCLSLDVTDWLFRIRLQVKDPYFGVNGRSHNLGREVRPERPIDVWAHLDGIVHQP
jgi:hypothetical protein